MTKHWDTFLSHCSYHSLSAAVQEGVYAFVGNESRLALLREDVLAFMQYAERIRGILVRL